MNSDAAEKLSSEIREMALKSGADLVGIVAARTIDSFPEIYVGWTIQAYTKKTGDAMPDARSIVVVGVHLWDDMLELAVRKDDEWLYPGYFLLDVPRLAVTNHLRGRGFKAVQATSISHKRLAQLAGFGNYGKNSLIINPSLGPWIRLAAVLTNAELSTNRPFEADLCGECDDCVKACPVGALTPYRVDDKKCLVGVHLIDTETSEYEEALGENEPSFTEYSHLMCLQCQKACKYGRENHSK